VFAQELQEPAEIARLVATRTLGVLAAAFQSAQRALGARGAEVYYIYIYIHTYIHTYIHIYIYTSDMYIYITTDTRDFTTDTRIRARGARAAGRRCVFTVREHCA
jgi:hypothetical protein